MDIEWNDRTEENDDDDDEEAMQQRGDREEEVEEGPKAPGWAATSFAILRRAWTLGRTAAIAGAALTSAPVVIPPLLALSTLGLAAAFPFGVYLAGVACTEKAMQSLLPIPPKLEEEGEEEGLFWIREEDEGEKPSSLILSSASVEEEKGDGEIKEVEGDVETGEALESTLLGMGNLELGIGTDSQSSGSECAALLSDQSPETENAESVPEEVTVEAKAVALSGHEVHEETQEMITSVGLGNLELGIGTDSHSSTLECAALLSDRSPETVESESVEHGSAVSTGPEEVTVEAKEVAPSGNEVLEETLDMITPVGMGNLELGIGTDSHPSTSEWAALLSDRSPETGEAESVGHVSGKGTGAAEVTVEAKAVVPSINEVHEEKLEMITLVRMGNLELGIGTDSHSSTSECAALLLDRSMETGEAEKVEHVAGMSTGPEEVTVEAEAMAPSSNEVHEDTLEMITPVRMGNLELGIGTDSRSSTLQCAALLSDRSLETAEAERVEHVSGMSTGPQEVPVEAEAVAASGNEVHEETPEIITPVRMGDLELGIGTDSHSSTSECAALLLDRSTETGEAEKVEHVAGMSTGSEEVTVEAEAVAPSSNKVREETPENTPVGMGNLDLGIGSDSLSDQSPETGETESVEHVSGMSTGPKEVMVEAKAVATFSNEVREETLESTLVGMGNLEILVGTDSVSSRSQCASLLLDRPPEMGQAESVEHVLVMGNTGSEEVTIEAKVVVPSGNEVLYSEEELWGQIEAMRTIVGYKAALCSSFMEEIRALYLFTGVEPHSSSEGSSHLVDAYNMLQSLKTIVGVH